MKTKKETWHERKDGSWPMALLPPLLKEYNKWPFLSDSDFKAKQKSIFWQIFGKPFLESWSRNSRWLCRRTKETLKQGCYWTRTETTSTSVVSLRLWSSAPLFLCVALSALVVRLVKFLFILSGFKTIRTNSSYPKKKSDYAYYNLYI